MTQNQVSEQVAKPDYTKVRGWLLAFGIYAGWASLSGAVAGLANHGAQRGLVNRLTPTDAEFYRLNQYVGYVLVLLFLVQCVCIFRRLRCARKLSLAIFAAKFLVVVASIPFLAAVVEATVAEELRWDIDLSAYARAQNTTLMVYAYVGVLLGLAVAVAGFLYFWRSERVKQTLVN